MQYKIPVQVENEDPILLGLSLRQLTIVMVAFGIGYAIFKSLEAKTGPEIAAIPSIFVCIVGVVIAIFKQYEMTFVPFVLSALRMNINPKERNWSEGIDSFQPLDVGYVVNGTQKVEEKIDFKSKMDKIEEINEKLKKI